MEVMVAVAILATGIVFIYRSFFISLDYLNHVANRLYAMTLVDNNIALMQGAFALQKEIPLGRQARETAVINNKEVVFQHATNLRPVAGLKNIYQIDASLSWYEGRRAVSIARAAYISKYDAVEQD